MSKWQLTFESYLNDQQVQALRKTMETAAMIAKMRGHQGPVRDQCIIEVALGTALRVSELCNLKLVDLDLKPRGVSNLIVRSGKGGKQRMIPFGVNLKNTISDYLEYSVKDSDYLFPSDRRDHMSSSAIQKVFKKWARKAQLPSRFSIHSLRHTAATKLYIASGYNLRLVQIILGHSHITTTSIYSSVVNPDLEKAVLAIDEREE
jgi:integrase/recombinase XerD